MDTEILHIHSGSFEFNGVCSVVVNCGTSKEMIVDQHLFACFIGRLPDVRQTHGGMEAIEQHQWKSSVLDKDPTLEIQKIEIEGNQWK